MRNKRNTRRLAYVLVEKNIALPAGVLFIIDLHQMCIDGI